VTIVGLPGPGSTRDSGPKPRYYLPVQGTGIGIGMGIGSSLRKARLLRGKSIEEASRETRIRADYLRALERERFDALLGDVYVRGFLRSYSTYLGLDADKVLTIYNRHFGTLSPTLPAPVDGPAKGPAGPHAFLPHAFRLHPSWTFMIGVALLALAVFGAAGLLSRSLSTPPSQNPAPQAGLQGASSKGVIVSIRAVRPVGTFVRTDATVAFPYRVLRAGEAVSFKAATRIEVRLDKGGAAVIEVNGHSLGRPGDQTAPYVASFSPQDYRGGSSKSGH
jgi:cytoskeleton protein RodZ